MWSYPCLPGKAFAGLALLCTSASADAATWFGDACPATSISVLPMPLQPRLQLVLARLSPLDSGESLSVLLTPDGQFWALRENFLAWRLPPPIGKPQQFDDAGWYSLEQVSGLQYRFDACSQELWLDVSGVTGVRNSFDVRSQQTRQISPVTEPGGHLNFDLLYLSTSGENSFSGTSELGWFTAQGYGLNSLLYDGARPIRLETQWVRDWPERAERLILGDSISRGGQIGQPLRLGGVQWGTEFSLQPDVVTFPLPSLRGQAALPSTVDIYINQVLRGRQDVPAGNFELNQVPVLTGSGEVQLVLRDLLGRSQVLIYPFYTSPTLLRAGLYDYSVQAGALREDFGFASNHYGSAFASGRLRKGVNDQLTSEIYAEAATSQQALGGGLAGIALPLGTWNAALAMSHSQRGPGAFGSAGFEHIDQRWNAAVQIKMATQDYAQLGEPAGALRAQWLLRAGFVPHEAGMLSLSYLRDDRRGQARSSILGANYGLRLAREWYLNAAVTRVFGGSAEGTGATLTLTRPFGGNKTFSVQEDRGPQGLALHRLSVQRDPSSALGLGYRLATEQGSSQRTSASARWSDEKGSAALDGETVNGDNSFRLGLSSALALLGKDLFWTRPVDRSFAVVDSGAPEVRIYQDNRLAGVTGEQGLLLIPGLRAYQGNGLRVEDADLPLRYAAQSLTMNLLPPARSGLRARFAVSDTPSVSLQLRQASGAPVPQGARVELDGEPLDLPVGSDGQAFIEAPPGRHRLRLRWGKNQCATLLVIAPDAGADLPAQTLECRP